MVISPSTLISWLLGSRPCILGNKVTITRVSNKNNKPYLITESRPYNKHMSYIFNLILIHSHICLPMWTGCIESTVIDQNALLHFLPKLLTSGRHVTHNLGYVITYLIVVVIFVIVFFRHFDMFDSWFSG